MKQKVLFFIIAAVVIYLISCADHSNNPGSGGNGNTSGSWTNPVTNLKASILDSTGDITLTWDANEGSSYKVYRYHSEQDTTPDFIFNAGTNKYMDTSIDLVNGSLFFYKVSAVKNNVESAKSDFVYGIGYNAQDIYENNDYDAAANDNPNFFTEAPPLLYSFDLGNGSRITDTDIYKFTVTAHASLNLTIKFNKSTSFYNTDTKVGDIYLTYKTDSEYCKSVDLINESSMDIYDSNYIDYNFPPYNNTTDNAVNLYLKIYVNPGSTNLTGKKIIDAYSIVNNK